MKVDAYTPHTRAARPRSRVTLGLNHPSLRIVLATLSRLAGATVTDIAEEKGALVRLRPPQTSVKSLGARRRAQLPDEEHNVPHRRVMPEFDN